MAEYKLAPTLPTGWRMLAIHVPDQGDEGTPEAEWEDTKNPQNPMRGVEFYWRGMAYLRISQRLPNHLGEQNDYDYCLEAGRLDDKEGTTVSQSDDLQELRYKARMLMRKGGYA